MNRNVFFAAAALTAIVLWFSSAQASMYMYVDRDGTVHLTNVPTHSKYRPFYGLGKFAGKKYSHHINRASRIYGLDPELVNAVIKAESDFQPQAVSSKGAMGLMQLMPETVQDMGVDDPFEPEDNIEGGVKYLSGLLKRFGSVELAVAAYNAGPGNVDKYKGIPPFDETRTFVARVMRYYRK